MCPYLPPSLPSDDGEPELRAHRFPMMQDLPIGYFAQGYGDLSLWCWGGCWRPNGARGLSVPETKNQSGPQTERNPVCVSETRTCQFSNIYFLPQRKDTGGKHNHIKKQLDLETWLLVLTVNHIFLWGHNWILYIGTIQLRTSLPTGQLDSFPQTRSVYTEQTLRHDCGCAVLTSSELHRFIKQEEVNHQSESTARSPHCLQ